MYVLIVDDNTISDDSLGSRIATAVHSVDPGIRCEHIDGGLLTGVLPDTITSAALPEAVSVDRHKIRVRCFGEFEVFGDGRPLLFKRVRTKELMAILVCHRGSMLSMGTLMSILWEDGTDSDSDRSYLRTMISDLKKTLSAVGAGDVIIKKYNSIGIDPGLIDCDYYDFLEGKWEAVQQYNGRFMSQYSWAEYELSHI